MSSTPGRLHGVGLGPGDPELITRKAARLIGGADVVAYYSGTHGRSIARSIAAELIPDGAVEERLVYPVTTGTTDHPGGYDGAIADFYDASAERLAAHLARGLDVVVLCEGDPLFYGSYMYLHDRLAPRFPAEVVPGVTSVSAASAATANPLVRRTDVLTVLPGTLPVPELARRLADADGAAVMKLGRTFGGVRDALEQAGRLDDAVYVERASMEGQRVLPVRDVDPASVPYFSVVLAPGDTAPRNRGVADRSRAGLASPEALPAVDAPAPGPAELLVVGLGPADGRWLTPEAAEALAGVDHVVGYGPYVDRVPPRPGQRRHSSGNTVEVDRARLALDLALAGERAAVVSGGDAGVFGMASAVFEAAQDPRYAEVPVRVLPGLSAVQAVAARAGAPIGGDFAVLSLSDRLKPWEVVEARLDAVARADLVLAVYNPASRSRTTQVARARDVLLRHRPGDTPVVVGRDVGRDGESLEVTTLGKLDPGTVDMRCLLIVGASTTSVTPSGAVWTRRYVRG
ncbi:precorrin-2 C(20)-methyltransferase [Actinorugispora endophytica]|uniref:Precorrin-3 methyltransferase /precorrin-2 C20-methyltransferase n=1 Tax=Actinorugispora endophytica TaxID=1605990 RepID=A0A4V3D976_9ACTN|nr:precorrin-2 C(20)-methyltransferase [Actinorugispora endophytica]TDQ55040.1 precorrin-3 methyltransferase /precorrin-2 C20-methyltransferase [Actinorugispora endophytica]